ncbi:MAG: hypothetical protein HQK52_21090 [Oligoflexia bacterium]|nr:hypothetical protein [Oligoflexia bacterium]
MKKFLTALILLTSSYAWAYEITIEKMLDTDREGVFILQTSSTDFSQVKLDCVSFIHEILFYKQGSPIYDGRFVVDDDQCFDIYLYLTKNLPESNLCLIIDNDYTSLVFEQGACLPTKARSVNLD